MEDGVAKKIITILSKTRKNGIAANGAGLITMGLAQAAQGRARDNKASPRVARNFLIGWRGVSIFNPILPDDEWPLPPLRAFSSGLHEAYNYRSFCRFEYKANRISRFF